MKRIIIASLLFSIHISAMDQRQIVVPYAQQRKIDGMNQLKIGVPLVAAGVALAYSSPPIVSGTSDSVSFFKFISGFLAATYGCSELIFSYDNLVCNDDECDENCAKACKAICPCEHEDKED